MYQEHLALVKLLRDSFPQAASAQRIYTGLPRFNIGVVDDVPTLTVSFARKAYEDPSFQGNRIKPDAIVMTCNMFGTSYWTLLKEVINLRNLLRKPDWIINPEVDMRLVTYQPAKLDTRIVYQFEIDVQLSVELPNDALPTEEETTEIERC